MAERIRLDRRTHDAIVRRGKAGKGRREIEEELGVSPVVVGKVLAANGLTKSKAEVRAKDRATVAKWLGSEARPTRKSAAKTASRRSRKTATSTPAA